MAFYGLQLRLVRTWRLGRRALLRRLVLTTIVAYVAFAVAIYVVPGIAAAGVPSILAAVVLIALINALLRPVVLALAVPLGIITVGILATALQFVVVLVVASVVPGIRLSDMSAAVETAVVFAVVNTAISWFIDLGEDESYFGHLIRLLIREGAPSTDVPGVVIVQIDGLSEPVLVNQIRAGRVPTMSRWIRSSSHELTPWRCQLPSQTSASQAGILLGSNDGIPAFRWYEKSSGRLMVSNRPADAAEIEARLTTGNGLLAGNGSSIGNLVSGGASESILTMSRLSQRGTALGPTRSWFYFFISPFAFARALFLTLGEAGKELWQARRQRVAGVEPRIPRGGSYPLLRGVTNVFLRQVTSALLIERILRGVPVMYADFVDYDEIAHHAGPERGESLDALDGVDRVLGALEKVALDAPRPYRFVVLSDHGQSQGATFRQRYGLTIEAVIRDLIGGRPDIQTATSTVEPWGAVNAFLTEVGRAAGIGGRLIAGALRSRSRGGIVELGPGRDEQDGARVPTRGAEVSSPAVAPGQPDLVVCASGNLALVYLTASRERLTLEEISALYPRLVDSLATHDGVGFVMVRSARHGAVAIGRTGRHFLEDDRVEGDDPLAPFESSAAGDLRRLDGMPNVGDLVLNSRLDPGTDEVAAFEELVGSHGGLGGWQTDAFLLHPMDWPVTVAPLVGAPAIHRQLIAWLRAAGLRQPSPVASSATSPIASV